MKVLCVFMGQDSAVSTVTYYGLADPEIESWWGRDFCIHPDWPWSPASQPASYTMGTGSLPDVKQLGCGVDHPPPSSAKFNTLRTGDADLCF